MSIETTLLKLKSFNSFLRARKNGKASKNGGCLEFAQSETRTNARGASSEGSRVALRLLDPLLTELNSSIVGRGLSLIGNNQTPIKGITRKFKGAFSFDGGSEISFFGHYNEKGLSLLKRLRALKEEAKNDGQEREVDLDGVKFYLNAKGSDLDSFESTGSQKVRFAFILKFVGADGLTVFRFYLHNPLINSREFVEVPGVRVKIEYPAHRQKVDFETVYNKICLLLSEFLGFEQTRNTLSRVDFNVTSNIPIQYFVEALENDRVFSRVNHFRTISNRGQVQTYSAGSRDSFEICIYDKVAELSAKNDDVKISDLLSIFGRRRQEWSRVEFRCFRSVLRREGINSVEDFLANQTGLLNYLTSQWFYIIDDDRKKDNSNGNNPFSVAWQFIRLCFLCGSLGFGNSFDLRYFKKLKKGLETAETLSDVLEDDSSSSSVVKRFLSNFRPRWIQPRPRRVARQGCGCISSSLVHLARDLSQEDVRNVSKGLIKTNRRSLFESFRSRIESKKEYSSEMKKALYRAFPDSDSYSAFILDEFNLNFGAVYNGYVSKCASL